MAVNEASTLNSAAQVLWRRIPDAVAQLSEALRAVLRDGDYLLAWPLAAVAALPLALLSGVLLGALHPGLVFSSSLAVILFLGVIAGLSSALGLMVTVGYAIGDLLLHSRQDIGDASSGFSALLRTDLALMDTYLIMGGLLIVTPIVAASVRRRSQRLIHAGSAGQLAGFIGSGLVQALAVYFWALSAAFMIRPVWSFWNTTPDIGSISTLQQGAVWIALAALLGVAARTTATILASGKPAQPAGRPYVRLRMRRPPPWPVPVVLRAALLTLLLAGLVGSALEAAVLFAVLAGLGVIQSRVVPGQRAYVAAITRVPLLLRVAACCLLGWVMSAWVVQPAIDAGSSSFRPMLVALGPPLVLAAILLPKVSSRRVGQ